jgi:hypothetical protein
MMRSTLRTLRAMGQEEIGIDGCGCQCPWRKECPGPMPVPGRRFAPHPQLPVLLRASA